SPAAHFAQSTRPFCGGGGEARFAGSGFPAAFFVPVTAVSGSARGAAGLVPRADSVRAATRRTTSLKAVSQGSPAWFWVARSCRSGLGRVRSIGERWVKEVGTVPLQLSRAGANTVTGSGTEVPAQTV